MDKGKFLLRGAQTVTILILGVLCWGVWFESPLTTFLKVLFQLFFLLVALLILRMWVDLK